MNPPAPPASHSDPGPTTWRGRKSGGGLFFAAGLLVLLLTGITMSPFPDLWPGFLISLLFSLYGLLRASSPRQRWIGIGLSFAAGVPGLLSFFLFAVRWARAPKSNRPDQIKLAGNWLGVNLP